MRSRIITAVFALTWAMPLLAHAQGLQRLVDTLVDIINFSLGILIGVAIIAFFWGLVMYLFGSKGGPEQNKASMIMVWGLVALFFMLSIFGIIRILQVSFGMDGSASVNAPAIGSSTPPSCDNNVTKNFGCFAGWIAHLFGIGTALLVGGALAIYFWGIAYHMFGYTASGSATSIQNLRKTLLWGLLALFVMFSIWGIIRVLGITIFDTNNFNSLY